MTPPKAITWLVAAGLLAASVERALAQDRACEAPDPPSVSAPAPPTAAENAEPAAPQAGFMRALGSDFRRLVSRDNSAIAAVFGAAAAAAAPWDGRASRALAGRSTPLFAGGNAAGAWATHLAAGAGVLLVGRSTNRPGVAALGSDLLRAQMTSQLVVQGLKFATGRTRPDASNHQSLPSGHTATAFATAAVLERQYGWRVGAPAYALGAYVAASRMTSKKHHLSDVLLGAVVGISAGRAVTVGSGRTTLAASVVPAPGGAAVTFTSHSR